MISSGRPSVSRFGVTKTATPSGLSTRAASATTRSGSGTCSSDWTESTEGKRPSPNGSARMSATTVSRSWPSRAAGVDVDAHRLPGRQQVEAVADPAAEVEHPPAAEKGSASAYAATWRCQVGLNPPLGDDPLAGDLHAGLHPAGRTGRSGE